MGFVAKRPSRMQEQCFFRFQTGRAAIFGRFKKISGGGNKFTGGQLPPGSDIPKSSWGALTAPLGNPCEPTGSSCPYLIPTRSWNVVVYWIKSNYIILLLSNWSISSEIANTSTQISNQLTTLIIQDMTVYLQKMNQIRKRYHDLYIRYMILLDLNWVGK